MFQRLGFQICRVYVQPPVGYMHTLTLWKHTGGEHEATHSDWTFHAQKKNTGKKYICTRKPCNKASSLEVHAKVKSLFFASRLPKRNLPKWKSTTTSSLPELCSLGTHSLLFRPPIPHLKPFRPVKHISENIKLAISLRCLFLSTLRLVIISANDVAGRWRYLFRFLSIFGLHFCAVTRTFTSNMMQEQTFMLLFQRVIATSVSGIILHCNFSRSKNWIFAMCLLFGQSSQAQRT